MNLLKKIVLILIFFSLTINLSKAEEKVSYVDIDYVLINTVAGKELINILKKEEELKINKFKSNEDNFKNEEKKILAKKNLISKDEINNELQILKVKFQKYRQEKTKEIDELKIKRNRNITNFLNLINPIIEKYMTDNSIYMLIDKKNVFIANKDYDITNNLIELIDNQIKNVEIK
jgi:Skp family chaperone for outer membrane proteins